MADTKPLGSTHSYRLSAQDATFIYAESETGPLHIGSIAIFEGQIDFEQLVHSIESRLHLVPSYRQRIAPVPFNLANAMMEDDTDFNVRNHVFRHQLPSGLSEAEAIEEMMRDYARILDRRRPLWEMHSFEGLEGDRTAIVSKVHHCLVDGVSGVELLKVMFDLKANPEPIEPPAKPWRPDPPTPQFKRLADAVRERGRAMLRTTFNVAQEMMNEPDRMADTVRSMAGAAEVAADLATRRIVAAPWNSGLVGNERSLAWSRHSFAEFRAIRNAFGGSINDVVLTILGEGAARYLKEHGYEVTGQKICVGCPVNVRQRSESTSLGNRVSMMFPLLNAEPMDVVERLHAITAETERIKNEGSAQALDGLMSMGDAIPPSMLAAVSRVATFSIDAASSLLKLTGYKPSPQGLGLPALGINFIATNVPGVQVPQYVLGHRCLDQLPLVPLGATLGYNVAILSYNQNLYFGMSAAPNLIPDVAVMKLFVDEAFDELRSRATAHEESRAQSAAAGAA